MKGVGKLVGMGVVVIAFALGLKESAQERDRQTPPGAVQNCPGLPPEELERYMLAMEMEDFATIEAFEQRCRRE